MNKKIIVVFLLVIVVLFGLSVIGKKNKKENVVLSTNQSVNNFNTTTPTEIENIPADKIEVVHFHGTHQCWSCITVGKYALNTIQNRFPEEYASGKVVFKDINYELPENKEIVTRYQAQGSSLYINAVRNSKDDIVNDVTVWRLVNDENQYTNYFESKLKKLLGK